MLACSQCCASDDRQGLELGLNLELCSLTGPDQRFVKVLSAPKPHNKLWHRYCVAFKFFSGQSKMPKLSSGTAFRSDGQMTGRGPNLSSAAWPTRLNRLCPKTLNKLCRVWIPFRSIEDAKIEASEVTIPRLKPQIGHLKFPCADPPMLIALDNFFSKHCRPILIASLFFQSLLFELQCQISLWQKLLTVCLQPYLPHMPPLLLLNFNA